MVIMIMMVIVIMIDDNDCTFFSDLEKGVDNEAYEPEIMEKMKDNFLHDNDGNDGEALQPLEPGYTRYYL